jgi:hypothetical protein
MPCKSPDLNLKAFGQSYNVTGNHQKSNSIQGLKQTDFLIHLNQPLLDTHR